MDRWIIGAVLIVIGTLLGLYLFGFGVPFVFAHGIGFMCPFGGWVVYTAFCITSMILWGLGCYLNKMSLNIWTKRWRKTNLISLIIFAILSVAETIGLIIPVVVLG